MPTNSSARPTAAPAPGRPRRTNGYDSCLRRNALVFQQSNNPLIQQSFSYDAASAASQTVTDANNNVATYSYVANSPLVRQIAFAANGMTTTNNYDSLNRLTSINSVVGSSAIGYSYLYNSANQRINVTCPDSAYWVYGYDNLGQVTAGRKYWSGGTPVAGQQFGYQFDTIGNRTGTDTGGDELGANLHHATYTPDNSGLNQYAQRDVPGYVQSIGSASSAANVALWTTNRGFGPAARKGNYFRAELPVNNTNGPVWLALTNVALLPGGSSGDTVTNVSGSLYLAQTPEHFGYDADGNLTNNGRWAFTWDAENRLIGVSTRTAVGPAQSIAFQYDWQGRRIRKQVWPNATGSGHLRATRFLYDGWNLIARLKATNNSVIQSYVWGLDLSGTPQGAGGVGGLLQVSDTASGAQYFVAHDGNGNVAGLVRATDGATCAQYEYGPFGELIRATGPARGTNPFRFSTKYQDDETDLLYCVIGIATPDRGGG